MAHLSCSDLTPSISEADCFRDRQTDTHSCPLLIKTHTHTHTPRVRSVTPCAALLQRQRNRIALFWVARRICTIAGSHGDGHDVDFHKCDVIYTRVTTTKSPSFCMTAFSASPTSRTVTTSQSRDCCYVSRPIPAAPPL